MQLDAVQLELLYHKLKATTEEMGMSYLTEAGVYGRCGMLSRR